MWSDSNDKTSNEIEKNIKQPKEESNLHLNWILNMPSLPRRDSLDVQKQIKQGHWTASASHLFM